MKSQTNKIKWQEVELKEVCEITSSKRIYQNEYVNEGVPFYRSKEVIELSKGQTISIELFISKKRYEELKERFGVPKRDDLLITAVGTIGISYVIPDNKEFYFKDGNLLWLRKLSNLNPNYLNYFLSNHFNKNKNDLSAGSSYNALTIVKLNKLKIPLPFSNGTPYLKEQERIVKILEKAKKVKEKGKNANDLLDEYLKSVFNELFYNKGFEEVELGDEKICLISGEYGSGASAKNFDGKVRYIRITDIDDDGNLRGEKVSPNKIEQKYFLQKGDLLFARSGATVGKTYLHNKEENFQYAGYLIRFRFNNKIIPKYTYFFTKTPKYLNWISLVQRVVAQPNINAKQYSSFKIPLPPLPLQQKFAKIVEHVEGLKENVKKTNLNSKMLFDSLMQKAFRGEL